MVFASSAGAPAPDWLDTLGKIAGVLLTLELLLVLIVMLALMAGLAFAARWVHIHVVPVLQENTPKLHKAMAVADTSTERVVKGVAEFYGRRQAMETGLRVFLFGRKQARAVHDSATARAAADIQLIDASAASEQSLVGPANGFTPSLTVADDADVAPTIGVGREGADSQQRTRDRDQDRDRHPDDGRQNGHHGQLAASAG